MTARTSHKTVTFTRPFFLSGIGEVQPAGIYRVGTNLATPCRKLPSRFDRGWHVLGPELSAGSLSWLPGTPEATAVRQVTKPYPRDGRMRRTARACPYSTV